MMSELSHEEFSESVIVCPTYSQIMEQKSIKTTYYKQFYSSRDPERNNCGNSRIDLSHQEALLGLTIKRRQFPAYAVTINKSQGQSYQYVGMNLETPFSHMVSCMWLSPDSEFEKISKYL